ncbi:MAG: 2-amino-4-hydroxy-6-hydroxymethyldihydropteridine diphosphokinase [Novosphingobium sp.]
MTGGQPHRYLIALGSNQPHHRHGNPRKVLAAALARLDRMGLHLEAASPVIETAPLGPSRRRYANGAALVRSKLDPLALLRRLQNIEAKFGRRRQGYQWRARVLDLDVVLWSGGAFAAHGLLIPHPEFRSRAFVLTPARAIAGNWRDPISGHTLRQLHFRLTQRLTHPHPLP